MLIFLIPDRYRTAAVPDEADQANWLDGVYFLRCTIRFTAIARLSTHAITYVLKVRFPGVAVISDDGADLIQARRTIEVGGCRISIVRALLRTDIAGVDGED